VKTKKEKNTGKVWFCCILRVFFSPRGHLKKKTTFRITKMETPHPQKKKTNPTPPTKFWGRLGVSRARPPGHGGLGPGGGGKGWGGGGWGRRVP